VSAPTIARALAAAHTALAGRVDDPLREAEYLLADVLGIGRATLLTRSDAAVTAAQAETFDGLVARRAAGEPAAYLLGRRAFWTLELEVTPDVLVPRHETELLVELALGKLAGHAAPRVLDLGTGSGAIGLAIASERRDAHVTLVDASSPALAVATRNRDRLGLGQVECLAGDWYRPVGGRRFDAIVSNPPYLATDDLHLALHELRHEPRVALVAGRTGLESIAAIAHDAPAHLGPGGWLLIEHGATQAPDVRGLFVAAGLQSVATRTDLAHLDRVTLGRATGA
jgi:release factor glutamine methyltransferase